MADPIRWRSKIILVKTEDDYAVDATPTGGANAMLLTNVELRPMEGEDVTREIEQPWLGAREEYPVALRAVMTGSIELVGSGSTGVAPAWGPMARACGLAEVITPDDEPDDGTVVYAPVSDEHESVTVHFWIGSTRHILLGARGTAELMVDAQGLPQLRVTLTGLFAKPGEQSRVEPDLSAFEVPQVATHANTPTFEVDEVPLVLRSFRLNLGNDVQPRLLIGREEILIVDRAEQVSATVEAVPLSTFDPFNMAIERDRFAVAWQHGTTAGHRTTIEAANCASGPPAGLREPAEHPGVAAAPDAPAGRRRRPVHDHADLTARRTRRPSIQKSRKADCHDVHDRHRSHLHPRGDGPRARRRRAPEGEAQGDVPGASHDGSRQVRYGHKRGLDGVPSKGGCRASRPDRRRQATGPLLGRDPRSRVRAPLCAPGAGGGLLRRGRQGPRGKLKWAARAWATGAGAAFSETEPEALRDAERFGLPAAAVEAVRLKLAGGAQTPAGGVWPENMAAVEAFLAVATQWRTAAIGGLSGGRIVFIGLDYAGAAAGLAAAGIETSPGLWRDVRIMEQAALAALNEG